MYYQLTTVLPHVERRHYDNPTVASLVHDGYSQRPHVYSGRSDDLNLGEVFQTMSKKDHTRVWASVLKAVAPIVDEGRFLAQEEEEEEEEEEKEEVCSSNPGPCLRAPPWQPMECVEV